MLNQPGMGLGFEASKLMADGLGTDFIGLDEIVLTQPYIHPPQSGAPWAFKKIKIPDRLKDLHNDDDEVLDILIRIITSGVLN